MLPLLFDIAHNVNLIALNTFRFELPTVYTETESGGLIDPNGPIDGGFPGDKPSIITPKGIEEEDQGTCITATCISFVTVGYCIVVIVMAVAYRKYRPRDRSKQFDRENLEDETQFGDDETEIFNPVFEEHTARSGGSSVRGSGSVRGGSVRGTMI